MKPLFNTIFLLGLFLTPILGYSQDLNNLNIVPPSPNAAALGKYGNTPVSLNTGTYSFSIPVYKYEDKGFSFTVSLDYHTGGIRVDEMASNVGLGWALSAGGMVSRSVVGLPDDSSPHGFMRNGEFVGTVDALREYNRGTKDAEPDVFNFNFNGRSGRFFINKDINGGVLVPVEKTGLKIEYSKVSATDPSLNSFMITTEDGMKYVFDYKETTDAFNQHLGILSYTSSWMLSRIEFPYSQKTISFTYESTAVSYSSGISQSNSYYLNKPGSQPYTDIISSPSTSTVNMTASRLLGINFPSGESISFIYNQLRSDFQNDKQLDFIYVDQAKTKGFKLEHGSLNGRLSLVKVFPVSGTIFNSPYIFDYNENLPPRLSLSQDFWGYNNGRANTTLIPKLQAPELSYFNAQYGRPVPAELISAADRSPDPEAVKAGVLKKVTYPTGGYTIFNHEIHTTADISLLPSESFVTKRVSLNGLEANKTVLFQVDGDYKAGAISFSFNFRDYPFGIDQSYAFLFEIKSLDDAVQYGSASFSYAHTNGHQFVVSNLADMPKGQYKLVWSTGYPYPIEELFTFSLSWRDVVTNMVEVANQYVGGLRIKEIQDYDGLGNFTSRSFKYVKEDGYSSSGKMMYKPVFSYVYHDYQANGLDVRYLSRSSYPAQSLSEVQGNVISYLRVIEYLKSGSLSNGEIQYKYSHQRGAYVDMVFPFPMLVSKPWQNGLLLEKKVFDNTGALKKKETNSYFENVLSQGMEGYKVGQTIKADQINFQKFTALEYGIRPGYSLKSRSRVVDYFSSTDSLSAVTDFDYEPSHRISHFQPVKITENFGTGQGKRKYLLYAKDYAGTAFINLLLSKNIINTPIEIVSVNENNEVIDGEINQYYSAYPGLKERISLLKLSSSVPLAAFKFSNQDLGIIPSFDVTRSFSPDSRYETSMDFRRYDGNGHLLNYSKPGSPQNSFLWSYNGKYPVVSIINADYTLIESILGGAAAIKSFSDSNPVSLTAIENFISLLRLDSRLKDAQFSVYSYDPLVGLTSSMDAKGVITYYEYDSFQRLKVIKDHNQHIIKSYDYNYKN